MKKVVRIVILSVFAFCLSIACKNYTEDIEDYLSYWSAGVSIAEYRFEPQPQIYTEGMQYVSSKAPVTVTFTVHNSKNLNLKMPGDSDAPADIISFPHIPDAPDKRAAAPQSGNDYEFKKISNTELTLTYTPAFLQKYEWGRGDITPSIILYTTDGRVFKQNIPFKLNVNTPPPAIAECVIGQTETAPPSETCYYVLCLQLSDDDMKKTCGNGLLHGDIAGVEINGTIYNLSVDRKLKQLKAQADSPFIGKDKVKKLAITDAKDIPSDWTLYFKTDVEVKSASPKKEYTVKLKDKKGLYSEPVTVGTQGKIVTLTFNLAGGNIGGNTDAIKKTGVPGASFTAPVPTRQGYTFNDWLPALPASPVFPAANVEYTAQWTPKTYTVTFKVDGEHGSLTGTHSGTPKTANGSTEQQFESVPHNSTINFTATPSGGWEVEKWMLDGNEVPGHTNTSYTLSNVTGNKTVKVKFKKKQGIIDGITETHAWKELCERVAAADDGTVITVKNIIAASAAAGNNGEIVINKNITIQGTNKTSETLNAGSFSRIFRVKDGKTLTLKNITLTGGNTQNEPASDKNGGGVYIENGSCTMDNVLVVECTANVGGAGYVNEGTFSISGDTRITPSTEEYEQTAGKNDVYLKNGKVITVTGTLTGTTSIARITPERYPTSSTPTVTVLEGSTVNTEYTKFKVTNQAGTPSKKWKINASGNLEAVGGQSPAIEATSWEALRTAVQSASDGTVIEVTQDITYGFTSVNSIIEVKKNITIKSKGSNKYTLDANGKGADREQSNDKSIGIFEVSGGKTLTLENLILTKTERYAVYVAEGDNSLTMKNVTIKDCKTQDNAAGIYFNKGKTLTLENCTIEKCNGNGGWSSGGIDIEKPTETVSIKDTTIKNCKAPGSDTTGGGIHLWNGECTLENVTVDNCSAKKGGGMCVKKSTLTITGGSFTKNAADGKTSKGGGGAIYSEDSTVTITGCTIGGDNVGDGNSAGQGGGIFVSEDARCTLNAGTKISGNKAIRIEGHNSSGGGIFVDKVQSGTQAGTLTINRSSGNPVIISENTADYGGGVYNYGTATINHAEIKGNNVPHHGGGMFNAGTCTMDGVTLQNNKAKSEGGGIYSNKELTLKNTTVTGNEATTSGGAIQIATADAVFNMSGSTVITVDASKNDIYLTNDAFITLTGKLTAEGKIARITLDSLGNKGYKADRVVVKGGGGFNITADYKDKFTITDKIGNPQHWKLIYQSNALKLK